jgi:glycine dehydrogenase
MNVEHAMISSSDTSNPSPSPAPASPTRTPTPGPAPSEAWSALTAGDRFVDRHVGPDDDEIRQMLEAIGVASLDDLVDQTLPRSIRLSERLDLPDPLSEHEALRRLEFLALQNTIHRNFIGCGYHHTATPAVIRRNILENPGWYTQYTPYQAEIAQGRLEALLNFQTMVSDLTGLEVANASLLDEATAAAEAMSMCVAITRGKRKRFHVSDACHPQTIAVMKTRAWSMGLTLDIGPVEEASFGDDLCGVLVQYPTTDGRVVDDSATVAAAHEAGALVVYAADLLALTLLKPPGEFGADIAVGSTQRFGVPMGGGGPHAAYMACHEKHVRKMPGRLVGLSRDADGNPAYRLAIQTREQHIKRDRATSNICTAQVLPAILASMYAVYHGPDGLRQIARRIHAGAVTFAAALKRFGYAVHDEPIFDTVTLDLGEEAQAVLALARQRRMNLRDFGDGRVGVSIDETTTRGDLMDLIDVFARGKSLDLQLDDLAAEASLDYPAELTRTSVYLTHEIFHRYRSETELMRYIKKLETRDLSLTHSMIPLGSCTMKLNAAVEMLPITWPQFSQMHPLAPEEQMAGYQALYQNLVDWLSAITGFHTVSLQPNAGSQGEYAGLLAIRGYHESRGETGRNVCLIPTSAHGTNPASAIVAGLQVVPVACDERGDIDLEDLKAKAAKHADALAALMITYPSTHGVFEDRVREVCQIVHEHGGQVYMDGANMNAQLGLTTPGEIGADVCHLNLHKTFCIPHGGGGPGMGPIGVAEHLADFLPGDPRPGAPESPVGPVSAAPCGSPSILPISWMYILMMGEPGLTRATQVAILNANYMAHRLKEHYPMLYAGPGGRCAHEFILDTRPLEEQAHITVDDIAKRLMDFGFHAPTMSWPVPGTMMVEPTESESKVELDRFCDAMIAIKAEADAVAAGEMDPEDNPLKHAPHTHLLCTSDDWPYGYGREQAAFPLDYLREHKLWPPVARIDNPYGDRNLVCTCPPMEQFAETVSDG